MFDVTLVLEPLDLRLPARDCPLGILGLLEGRLAVRQGPAVEWLCRMLIDLFFHSRWVGKAEGNGQEQTDEHTGQHVDLFGAIFLVG